MRAATTIRTGPAHRATRRPPGRLDSHKNWTDRRGLVTGGDSCSGCSRWGDWYSLSINSSGNHFWLASQLATANGTTANTYPKWTTSIANINMNV
jgi:hypothetical protein